MRELTKILLIIIALLAFLNLYQLYSYAQLYDTALDLLQENIDQSTIIHELREMIFYYMHELDLLHWGNDGR